MSGSETINLGDAYQVEAGARQILARFASGSPNSVAAALPYITIGWHGGNSTVAYRLATALPDADSGVGPKPLHRCRASPSAMAAWPSNTAFTRRSAGSAAPMGPASPSRSTLTGSTILCWRRRRRRSARFRRPLRPRAAACSALAAPAYSTSGVVASFQHRLARSQSIRVAYADGDALTLSATPHPTALALLAASTHPRRVQMYSLSLSGIVDGTGTRWRASYRWQPDATVTRVAPYAEDADAAFLNLHFRQPICKRGENARSLDAVVDMHNVLGQGRRPFILTDGSLLLFAQEQRALSAGLAFSF